MKSRVWSWVCWLAVACSANAQQQTLGVTEPLGEGFKVPHLLVKEQSRLVFYRLATDLGVGVATVYINSVYQASLQRGAYTEVCLSPSTIEVSALMVRNGVLAGDAMDVLNTLLLKGGDDVFVRVSEQVNGRAVFVTVKPEQALPELVKLRAQQHTLTRVPNASACKDAPPLAKTPVNAMTKNQSMRVQSITLEADALFGFGKSDVESIPIKGRRILDHLVDRIKTEFGSGDRVHLQIVGFADGFGSEATNMRLSKERAAAIKAYFVQGGLSAGSIKTDGRGDKGRVITTCGTKLTPENVACNKPNRRVVVTVYGTQAAETKE